MKIARPAAADLAEQVYERRGAHIANDRVIADGRCRHDAVEFSVRDFGDDMLTAQLAYELRDTPIKVNSGDLGFTATNLSQHQGRPAEESARHIVELALLEKDGQPAPFLQPSTTPAIL